MADTISDPARLDALERSGLLRHDVAGRLDVLCETTATMLRVPMVFINVLDAEMQHTVGHFPTDGPMPDAVEIGDTGCELVVLAQAPVVVPDTTKHPVLCSRPFVTEDGMRAYLGVPIRSEGRVIGTLCCVDWQTRQWRHYEVSTLEGLGDLVLAAVEAA